MPTLFDPQTFFRKVSHYASQGRGLFRIPNLPVGFYNNLNRNNGLNSAKGNVDTLQSGKNLLENGIVASAFSIPSSTLATLSPYSYTGPTVQMPYNQQFNNLDVTFLLMGKSREEAASLYYLFMKWHELIAGPRPFRGSSEFNSTNAGLQVKSNHTMFALEYYDNYTCESSIEVFSPTSSTLFPALPSNESDITTQKVLEVRYTEMYPQAIQQMALSWDNPDVPLSLSVSFAFHYAHVYRPSTSTVTMSAEA